MMKFLNSKKNSKMILILCYKIEWENYKVWKNNLWLSFGNEMKVVGKLI